MGSVPGASAGASGDDRDPSAGSVDPPPLPLPLPLSMFGVGELSDSRAANTVPEAGLPISGKVGSKSSSSSPPAVTKPKNYQLTDRLSARSKSSRGPGVGFLPSRNALAISLAFHLAYFSFCSVCQQASPGDNRKRAEDVCVSVKQSSGSRLIS